MGDLPDVLQAPDLGAYSEIVLSWLWVEADSDHLGTHRRCHP